MRRHLVRSLAAIAAAAMLVAGWVAPAAPVARAATSISVPGDFATLQAAVDAAVAGDTVLVAPGTYSGHVAIYKSITLQATGDAASTIIDGGDTGWVLSIDGAAAVRGFMIRNGLGDGVIVTGTGALIEHNEIVDNTGCGVEAPFAVATIRDNHVARNAGTCGGIYARATGNVTITGNVVEDNSAGLYPGGGISVAGPGGLVDSNIVRRNRASEGAGLYLGATDATVTNNLVAGNVASSTGGGIALQVPAGAVVANNTVAGNTAPTGAGIYTIGSTATTIIRNNVVISDGNAATVSCNGANGSTPPALSGNDVWNATGTALEGQCAGVVGTDGNVSVDPRLVDPDHGDDHLRPDSPLIDHGVADAIPAKDIDGETRPFDGDEDGVAVIDPGFDESTDPLLVSNPFLYYGTISLGSVSHGTETLQNLGSGSLSVTTISVDGLQAGDFAMQADSCSGATLEVGATCSVTVVFGPLAAGDRSATLTVNGPGAVGTRSIALTGHGADPVQVNGSLVFDGQPLHEAVTQQLTLTNYGIPVAVSGVAIDGTGAADFAVAGETCTTAPVGACTVDVTFTPSVLGAREATLTITGDFPIGTRTVLLWGLGRRPLSPVAWRTTYAAGPAYTWNYGGALARSVQSGTQRLHLLYATNRVSSRWVGDAGPYLGVYYVRGGSGSSWTTAKRLNPTNQHAERPAVAAASSRVYTAWVSQARVATYKPTSPRVLWFRANTSYGSTTAWSTARRLTSTTGRVDFPTIAATGTDVHVAYTDSVTGSVRLASSTNRGSTFLTRTIGATTYKSREGFQGVPSVAASGSTVVVAWASSAADAVSVRISTDRGAHWGTTRVLAPSSGGSVSAAVRGTRIAVTWNDGRGVILAVRNAGTWAPDRIVAGPPVLGQYGPAVTLQDPNRVAVAWSEVTATGLAELRWAESPDGGVQWYEAQVVGPATVTTRRVNDWPSLVWVDAGTRIVAWNGWTDGTLNYRQYVRTGTGTPPSLLLHRAPLAGAPAATPVTPGRTSASTGRG